MSGGESIVAFFLRLGVPNADVLKPDELDWMLDNAQDKNNEQTSLLAFLTSSKLGHLSAEKNVLTSDEMERWAEFERTETVLSGDLLEQALQVVKSSETESGQPGAAEEAAFLEQLTDEELKRLVADKRGQLQVQENELDHSERALEAIGLDRSDLRRDLHQTEQKERQLGSQIRAKQQKLLHVDQKRHAKVTEIDQEAKQVVKCLANAFDSQPSPFVAGANLQRLIDENRAVRGEIENFCRTEVEAKRDKRSPEEKVKFAFEAAHLSLAYQTAAGNLLIKQAELKATQAATKEIQSQTSNITQMIGAVKCGLEESSLLNMIGELETTVAKIEEEWTDLTKGELPKHLQAKATAFVSKIQQIEADSEIKRKEACVTVMEMVVDMLHHRRAQQQVFFVLLQHEWRGLQWLKSILEKVKKQTALEKDNERSVEKHVKETSDLKTKLSRNTLQPEDKIFNTLYKMLSSSGVEQTMLTVDEVLKMMSDFQVKLETDKRHVRETEERWQLQRQHVEESIRSIHKELRIDDLNCGGVMVKPAITKKIQEVEIRLRDYEKTVKVEIQDLEKQKQELKGLPLLGIKLALGKDLMDKAAS